MGLLLVTSKPARYFIMKDSQLYSFKAGKKKLLTLMNDSKLQRIKQTRLSRLTFR